MNTKCVSCEDYVPDHQMYRCHKCKDPVCEECVQEVDDEDYCPGCATELEDEE